MTGDDTGFLVVASSIACQFKDLSSQVFHDSGQVDWCSCSLNWQAMLLATTRKPV